MGREMAKLKDAADERERWITNLGAKIQCDEKTTKK
jgi:hypothetical protein